MTSVQDKLLKEEKARQRKYDAYVEKARKQAEVAARKEQRKAAKEARLQELETRRKKRVGLKEVVAMMRKYDVYVEDLAARAA